jgi:hypothetical protein
MRKLFFLILTGLISGTGYSQTCPTPTTTGAHLTLDASYQTGTYSRGKTDVSLCFNNTSAENITAVQFRVFYDVQAFSGVDTVESLNTTFTQYLQYQDNPAGGYVTLTLTYTGNNSSFTIPNGQLFKITYNHKPALATTYFNVANMTFTGVNTFPETATKQNGTDYALTLTNFGGAFLKNQFSFGGKFVNVTGTPAKNINVVLEKKLKTSSSWSSVQTQQAGLDGSFDFANVEVDTTAWDVRINVKGDTLSVGNVVSVSDAQRINQYVLGQQTASGFDFYSSDVNGDNKINISDVYGVYARVSGRFSSWANNVPEVKFFSESEYNTINTSTTSQQTTIPGVTNFTFDLVAGQPDSVTFYVLVPGDANGTGFKRARLTPIEIVNPNNANLHIIDVTTEYDNNIPSIEINFPTLGVMEGDIVSVPVILKSSTSIGSLQLSMKYDTDLLEFVSLENELKSGYWISYVNPQNNEVEWGGFDPSNNQNLVNNGEILFTLNFRAKKVQSNWNKSPLYVTRKFAGNNLSNDLKITPTDGILQILKTDGLEFLGDNTLVVSPNPTAGPQTATFKILKKSQVKIGLYDIYGKKYFEFVDGTYPIGIYQETYDLGELAAGVYYLRMDTEEGASVQRIGKVK